LVSARLRIDERVLHYLAGVNYLDPRLQPLLRHIPEPSAMAETQLAIARGMVAALEEALGERTLPLVQLWGDDPHGKHDVAAWTAARHGLLLHAIAQEDIPVNPHEMEALAALWERESALLD